MIFAAVSLMDLAILGRYFRVRKSALALSLVATVGVILFGVLWGIAIAVILAVLMFFRRNWWPHGAVLGQVEGLPGWHGVDKYPDARQRPGIVVYRWEAPLFFANSGIFREQVRRLAREQSPAWIVLQCEAVTDIDVTAAGMLEQLDNELNARGIHLAFAELRDRLQDRVLRYGLFETLDRDHFYPTLKAAVRTVEALGPLPPAPADRRQARARAARPTAAATPRRRSRRPESPEPARSCGGRRLRRERGRRPKAPPPPFASTPGQPAAGAASAPGGGSGPDPGCRFGMLPVKNSAITPMMARIESAARRPSICDTSFWSKATSICSCV